MPDIDTIREQHEDCTEDRCDWFFDPSGAERPCHVATVLAALERMTSNRDDLLASLLARNKDADRLAEALRGVQWSYTDDMGTYDACPECLGDKPTHTVKCDIGIALRQHDDA